MLAWNGVAFCRKVRWRRMKVACLLLFIRRKVRQILKFGRIVTNMHVTSPKLRLYQRPFHIFHGCRPFGLKNEVHNEVHCNPLSPFPQQQLQCTVASAQVYTSQLLSEIAHTIFLASFPVKTASRVPNFPVKGSPTTKPPPDATFSKPPPPASTPTSWFTQEIINDSVMGTFSLTRVQIHLRYIRLCCTYHQNIVYPLSKRSIHVYTMNITLDHCTFQTIICSELQAHLPSTLLKAHGPRRGGGAFIEDWRYPRSAVWLYQLWISLMIEFETEVTIHSALEPRDKVILFIIFDLNTGHTCTSTLVKYK